MNASEVNEVYTVEQIDSSIESYCSSYAVSEVYFDKNHVVWRNLFAVVVAKYALLGVHKSHDDIWDRIESMASQE